MPTFRARRQRIRRATGARGSFFSVQVAFDPLALHNPTLRAADRILRQGGVFIRRKARALLGRPGRNQKKRTPGKPPISRTGRLRAGIAWYHDRHAMSVIIGPRRYPDTIGGGKAPRALEKGGRNVVNVAFPDEHRAGIRRLVPRNIDKRPYMGPALVKTLPALRNRFRDSIRRTF